MSQRGPRVVAGAAVLLILVIVAGLLIPPYAANWRLQSYVTDLVDDPATTKLPPETVRTRVLNQAAALGLPVHGEDVHVGVNAGGSLKIDVLYIVHVEMAGYTIDLHFRPTAGS